MNVFTRIHDIVSSNVNSALDKMEDPKKMINLTISEMEETVVELRGTIAAKKAELITITRQIKETEAAITRWSERAQMAVDKNNDELAKEAITEKNRLKEHKVQLESTKATLESIVTTMEEQLAQVNTKLSDMKAKRDELIARGEAAKRKLRTAETLKEADSSKYMQRFEELQARIERWEAEAKVYSAEYGAPKSTRETFESMEEEKAVNEELEALKAAKNNKKENA